MVPQGRRAGNARGMTNLGLMYENGTGVAKDAAEAVRWYRKAADAGDAPGMSNLGLMYGKARASRRTRRRRRMVPQGRRGGNQDAKDNLKRLGRR